MTTRTLDTLSMVQLATDQAEKIAELKQLVKDWRAWTTDTNALTSVQAFNRWNARGQELEERTRLALSLSKE